MIHTFLRTLIPNNASETVSVGGQICPVAKAAKIIRVLSIYLWNLILVIYYVRFIPGETSLINLLGELQGIDSTF